MIYVQFVTFQLCDNVLAFEFLQTNWTVSAFLEPVWIRFLGRLEILFFTQKHKFLQIRLHRKMSVFVFMDKNVIVAYFVFKLWAILIIHVFVVICNNVSRRA